MKRSQQIKDIFFVFYFMVYSTDRSEQNWNDDLMPNCILEFFTSGPVGPPLCFRTPDPYEADLYSIVLSGPAGAC